VPHHLIDIVDPAEPFTVSDYRLPPSRVTSSCWSGKIPLVVGGTRLYLMSLSLHSPLAPPDPVCRSSFCRSPLLSCTRGFKP